MYLSSVYSPLFSFSFAKPQTHTTKTQAKEKHFKVLAINWWKSFERWEVVSGKETYPELLHVSDFSSIAINTKHGVLTICMLQTYQQIVAY